MGSSLTGAVLAWQNRCFAGTGGVSTGCSEQGFVAAFRDESSGETLLSRFEDGTPANVHVLDGLPDDWVACRDEDNHVTAVRDTVVAGFLHHDRFYTRDEVASLLSADAEG